MFQFDWAARELWSQEPRSLKAQPSRIESTTVRSVMLLHWQEHCVECAIPQCYSICPLYVRRKDQKCARFVYGIVQNSDFPGLFPFGADLRFRRWGKIEARLTGRDASVAQIRLLGRADHAVRWTVGKIADVLSPVNPKRKLQGALTLVRDSLLSHLGNRRTIYDAFLVECYSFHPVPFKLIVELQQERTCLFREALELQPGHNVFSLPILLSPGLNAKAHYKMLLYPDEDMEVRVVFSWLDFVQYDHSSKNNPKLSLPTTQEPLKSGERPAEKLKCVAWDLDNTLWRGILVEDGRDSISIRPEAVDLIRRLDERGIIQTVVSKNNHEDAMEVLKRNGLEEYFLYPAINWGQKSANLTQVANRLNINIDTFALIDDSPFERREVSTALPMVRVYKEDSLSSLLSLPEFDVPVTEESRLRRQSYRTETQRERVKEQFGPDYLEFLRSCQLKLKVYKPDTSERIARCLELIQRSNQLNLSSRRYDKNQFAALLANEGILCVAMECSDRFGNYGIVGFASIDLSGTTPVAKDFVLSCRVAQKRVEHAFYGWLGTFLKRRGATKLQVDLIKTAKNRPLVQVFEEMPFETISAEGDMVVLSMELSGEVVSDLVVAVDDASFQQGSVS